MGDEPHGQLWVAFVCIPAFGHAKPLLNFAAQLLDAQSNYQYRVSFLTSASCIDYLKSKCDPRIELIGIEDGVIPEFKRMDLGKPKEVKKHVVLWLRDQMRPALNQYFEGVTETTGKQPDLFICDHLSHAGADCAASLGVPYVVHLAWPLFMLSVIGVLPWPGHGRALGPEGAVPPVPGGGGGRREAAGAPPLGGLGAAGAGCGTP